MYIVTSYSPKVAVKAKINTIINQAEMSVLNKIANSHCTYILVFQEHSFSSSIGKAAFWAETENLSMGLLQ